MRRSPPSGRTGQSAIEHDLEPVQSHDLEVGELYLAIPIALLILILVFGTLAFLLPFLLSLLGDRLDRVRLVPRRIIERREDVESSF